MARIRTLKPEFWTDEKMALLPPLTRLVFLGLISQADDAGRLVDNVKLLDGLLFPYTDDSCAEALDELASIGRVIRYRSDSGQPLLQLANWKKHQNVQKPSKYTLPAPSEGKVQQPSRDSPETPRRVPVSDPRPTTPDLRPTTAEQCDPPVPGWEDHAAACVDFVKANGYGAKEVLMAEGEDGPAWAGPDGAKVPWDDRLRLLKLAHARVVDKESNTLRSALRYVIPQQLDPTMAPTSADFAKRRQDAETPVAARPVNAVTASGEKAKSEAKRAAYTTWKERTREALDSAGAGVRAALEREVEASIGEIALRNMPPAARERAMEDMVLQRYGDKIGQPAPAVAA